MDAELVASDYATGRMQEVHVGCRPFRIEGPLHLQRAPVPALREYRAPAPEAEAQIQDGFPARSIGGSVYARWRRTGRLRQN